MGIKKRTYYILIAITVLFLFGCKKNTTDSDSGGNNTIDSTTVTLQPVEDTTDNQEVQSEESHEGQMRSNLSGLWVSNEIGLKRPYAFQFNNFKTVSNQWGIGQADIVYECIVEGGITRLLGIGENYTGDRIGSTRSARHYFVSIADEYDAIYIHYGATKYARSKVKELEIDEMDGNAGSGSVVFYRDKSINAPHNAFASVEGILKGIEKNGFETQYPGGYEPHFSFYEEDTDLASGSEANKVTLDFSSYINAYFDYNSTDKLYYRFQFGAPHVDSLTGEQLAFKNIIIQFVKEWNIDKKGYQTMDLENASGSGFYITNGKGMPITWKKKEAYSWMRYYNAAGEELTINPGKTYITLFPNNRTEDAVIR
ncbi:MAG: DUF3048 domain-containing protein, partial [Herbinix sp.]|nr:DUF3048 domain-containing protein [Herbinix sp.]